MCTQIVNGEKCRFQFDDLEDYCDECYEKYLQMRMG